MIFEPFDVVVVPFPFSDLPRSKKRKALIVSNREFNQANGSSVLLMITSATHSKWLFDVPITDLESAGLKKTCVVRMKSFTLDNGLILERSGHLIENDAKQVAAAIKSVFALSPNG